jgi:NitT/TauT family transport system substrate-binding protein
MRILNMSGHVGWRVALVLALVCALGLLALAGCSDGSGGGEPGVTEDGADGSGDADANGSGDADADSGDAASGDAKSLSFAYQYGIQYLPAKIVKEEKLIEKHYGGDVTIEWKTLASGAEVNEAIIAGTLQGGFMGPPPAITGVTKGVPYKIFTGISKIPNRMMVNNPDIKGLKDVGEADKIALVGEGSTQHIMLAMAAKKELGDSHAFDTNIIGTPHPDGMTALLGGQVTGQVTSMPYSYMELQEQDGITQIENFVEDGIPGSAQIVGVLAVALQENDPELYQAIIDAFDEANTYLNNPDNFDAIAEGTFEEEGVTKEKLIEYLQYEDTVYAKEVTGLMELAQFMYDEGFLEKEPASELSGFCFDGVTE